MFNNFSWRRLVIVVFVLGTLGEVVVEITSEIANGEAAIDMVDDIAMLLTGLAVLAMFIVEYWQQQHALVKLRADLEKSRGRLANLDAESPQIADRYRRVMQKQFDVWRLTSSEQDVVLGLLKGLSFREVAELRETREKTVRQQAANVYKKAGVAGRHELAGWFFEDLLHSPGASAAGNIN